MAEGTGKSFSIQWHITHKCQQRCQHCYIRKDSQEYDYSELDLRDCLHILDDAFITVTEKFRKNLYIAFSGGDPLLCGHFFDLMTAAKERGIKIGVMANPHLITDRIARKLRDYNLRGFQFSIDGSEITHDSIRQKGSYKKTAEAIKTLLANGVPVDIMATFSRFNVKDMPNIVDFCCEQGVRLLSFDLFIPNSREDIKEMLSPFEVRSLMLDFKNVEDQMKGSTSLIFGRKNNLWSLLYEELGLESAPLKANRTATVICAGCSIGISSISVLPDGTVYACRRLPIAIGKFPEHNLEEVFFGTKLNFFRQEEKIEECAECSLFKICRGCRAAAYMVNGDYFSKDPTCWKHHNPARI